MMRTNDFNVAQQLNDKTWAYFHPALSYSDLRAMCLRYAPIQAIIDGVSVELHQVAEIEKTGISSQLIVEAHQQQIAQDDIAEGDDGRLLIAILANQRGLTGEIERSRSELVLKTTEFLHQEARLSQARASLPATTINVHHIATSSHAHHGHPSQHRPTVQETNALVAIAAQRRLINELSGAVESTHYNLRHLEGKVSRLNSELHQLSRQQEQLDLRVLERTTRKSFRQAYNDKALTSSNLATLRARIQASNHSTDAIVVQKMYQAQENCHVVFLNQLNLYLEHLRITPDEKEVLGQLIAKMQAYHGAVQEIQKQKRIFSESEASHTRACESQAQATKRGEHLDLSNKRLTSENETLAIALPLLQAERNKRLMQRNQSARYAFTLTEFALIVATFGFFLIDAGMVMLPPIVPVVFAAVVGAGVLGLAIFSCVAAIRAYFRGSDIDKNMQQQHINEEKIQVNTTAMSSTNAALPQLTDNVYLQRGNLEAQRGVVQRAELFARGLLQAANDITVNKTGVVSSCGSRDAFFLPDQEPSAPFFPNESPIQSDANGHDSPPPYSPDQLG